MKNNIWNPELISLSSGLKLFHYIDCSVQSTKLLTSYLGLSSIFPQYHNPQ